MSTAGCVKICFQSAITLGGFWAQGCRMVFLFPDPVTAAVLLSTGGDTVGCMPYTHQASWQPKEFENRYYSLPPVAVISILILGDINENISCFHLPHFQPSVTLKYIISWALNNMQKLFWLLLHCSGSPPGVHISWPGLSQRGSSDCHSTTQGSWDW